MRKDHELAMIEPIENKILFIRGQRVILDSDLAVLYGVRTKNLIKAVRRNLDRFPSDFVFRLSEEEFENLRFQNGTSSSDVKSSRWGGRRYLPFAFTEHGTAMAANVLRSKRAIQASIYVVRAFVKLRQFVVSHYEIMQKLDELERNVTVHDKAICSLFDAIRKLMAVPEKPGRKIGFALKGK